MPVDNFSARWTRPLNVAEDSPYEFTVTADDGVRLFVDGQKVLDKWTTQGRTTFTVTRSLTQGQHQIVLEYFEAGGDAVAKLTYEKTAEPPPPPEPFAAEYFDNQDLAGAPILTRNDDAIDFDWGVGSPNFAIPVNQFSARWTRTRTYEGGTYRFSVTGDDGIRVLIDGDLVGRRLVLPVTAHLHGRHTAHPGPAYRHGRVLRVRGRGAGEVQREPARPLRAGSASRGPRVLPAPAA